MKLKAKQKKILLLAAVIVVGLIAFFKWQNNSISINEIVFKNDIFPES